MLCPMAHFVIMGVGRVGISLAHALEDSGPVSYTHLTLPTKA